MSDIYSKAEKTVMSKPDWSSDGRERQVYKLRIENLFYNEDNGRIATWISEYKSNHGEDSLENLPMHEFNDLVHQFIKNSNTKESFVRTYNDIREKGQIRPGVILSDGRIVSGNRRFTVLRELYKDTSNDKYAYFECFIVDKSMEKYEDRKEIKTIERLTQFGVDEKVGYDPIDRLVDVYNDLIGDRKIWEVKEYSKKLNIKLADVQLMYRKAELMAEYLEFINRPRQFYHARALKLDGPLQEIANLLKKVSEQEWKRIRIVFYYCFEGTGDTTRLVRDRVKLYKNDRKAFNKLLDRMVNDIEDFEQKKAMAKIEGDTKKNIGSQTQEISKTINILSEPKVITKETNIYAEELVKKNKAEQERVTKIRNIHKAINTIYSSLLDAMEIADEIEKAELKRDLKVLFELIRDRVL